MSHALDPEDVVAALAIAFQQHGDSTVMKGGEPCGCDLCDWIQTTPGVLEAITQVDL